MYKKVQVSKAYHGIRMGARITSGCIDSDQRRAGKLGFLSVYCWNKDERKLEILLKIARNVGLESEKVG